MLQGDGEGVRVTTSQGAYRAGRLVVTTGAYAGVTLDVAVSRHVAVTAGCVAFLGGTTEVASHVDAIVDQDGGDRRSGQDGDEPQEDPSSDAPEHPALGGARALGHLGLRRGFHLQDPRGAAQAGTGRDRLPHCVRPSARAHTGAAVE